MPLETFEDSKAVDRLPSPNVNQTKSTLPNAARSDGTDLIARGDGPSLVREAYIDHW
jgi:hypothetical protein